MKPSVTRTWKHSPVLLLCCLIGMLSFGCSEDSGPTDSAIMGLQFEDIMPDALNAFPILGFIQTGSDGRPVIDGDSGDPIWFEAVPYEVTTEGGAGGFGPTVTLKALYDNYNIFILASWADETESVDPDVWWYGEADAADTTLAMPGRQYGWNRVSELFQTVFGKLRRVAIDTTKTPPDTTYFFDYQDVEFSGNEDRLSIMWNVSSQNFLNCSNLCHGDAMRTDTEEMADVWMWKAGSTNPIGYADDEALTDAGFQADDGEAAFSENVSGSVPQFMHEFDPGSSVHALFDSTALAFYADTSWTGGDFVPGYVQQMPSGNRGNIKAVATRRSGEWVLEIRRGLLTEGATDTTDVQFDPDAESDVSFHVAVYDNAGGGDHAISSSVQTMHFVQLKDEE